MEIQVDSFPDTVFKGDVYAIDPRIDRNTRTVAIKATVPNAEGKLRPGMFARVRLVLETRTQALLVPEQSLVPQGKDKFIYVVVDGKAERRVVKIGKRLRGKAEILDGIAASDTIVVTGHQKLRPGATIRAIDKPATAQSDNKASGG